MRFREKFSAASPTPRRVVKTLGAAAVYGWLGLGAYALTLPVARSAAACGALPTPVYSLTQVFPEDGAKGVLLDAPLVIQAVANTATGNSQIPATVNLVDVESGASVAGKIAAVDSEPATVTWRTDKPLLANHKYEATVLVDAPDKPSTNQRKIAFTTGDELLAPLELDGGLMVSLGPIAILDIICTGPCGGDCTQSMRMAFGATVTLPKVHGGFLLNKKYQAHLYFSDNSPEEPAPPEEGEPARLDFDSVENGSLEEGQQLKMYQELFDREKDYAPCFTFIVVDGAGNKVTRSKCSPTIAQAELRAQRDAVAPPAAASSSGMSSGGMSSTAMLQQVANAPTSAATTSPASASQTASMSPPAASDSNAAKQAPASTATVGAPAVDTNTSDQTRDADSSNAVSEPSGGCNLGRRATQAPRSSWLLLLGAVLSAPRLRLRRGRAVQGRAS